MIIPSLLDTDLYKLTMMQVIFHKFKHAQASFAFTCRTPGIDHAVYLDEIQKELEQLCQLNFTAAEIEYLRSLDSLTTDFVDYLENFKLTVANVELKNSGEFSCVINGSWLECIMFEVPLLAIISEVYFRNMYPNEDYAAGEKLLKDKCKFLKKHDPEAKVKFSDFGTRRRFSFKWQEHVIQTLQQELPNHFIGTSNIHFAKQFSLTPIGTMAHEYLQACQVLAPSIQASQKFAFETWLDEFKGQLGIALSDVFTTDIFLRDFDQHLSENYTGARHDSGDPLIWGERLVLHYNKLGIDPMTKTLVFSDSLTFPKALEIQQRFAGRINTVFGIGTYLTNDLGHLAPQIVIKMTHCNGHPVAKITDDLSKSICVDADYLVQLQRLLGINSIN